MRGWCRFIVWRRGGDDKVPLDPETGYAADDQNPLIWLTYSEARQAQLSLAAADGIGFVLDNTPFALVDLDECIDSDGVLTEFAGGVLRALSGVEERSVSGKGMHSLVRAAKPSNERCGGAVDSEKVEIYDSKRFVAIADKSIVDQPIPERSDELAALYERVFGSVTVDPEPPPARSAAESILEDDEALQKARSCKTTGKAFRRLFDYGDASGYRSRSEAHYRLCRMLAYWCAADTVQIERLFWRSALAGSVERKKPQKYLRWTVGKAIAAQPRRYEKGAADSERVSELAQAHLQWSEVQEFVNDFDRAVYREIVRHAGQWAYLVGDGGALEFNANQSAIAKALTERGVPAYRRAVGRSLARLCCGAFLERTTEGTPGSNSRYLLHVGAVGADLSTMQQQVDMAVHYVTSQVGGSPRARDAHTREGQSSEKDGERDDKKEKTTGGEKEANVTSTADSDEQPPVFTGEQEGFEPQPQQRIVTGDEYGEFWEPVAVSA